MNAKKFLPAAAAVIALLLGIAAASLWFAPAPSAIKSGTLLPQPRDLPEFSLIDQDGKPYTRAALQGRWSLVFPGFTHCPDICPTTLALLNTVHAELARRGLPLNIVFLSVDPERDTPQRLDSYVRHFNPAFSAVTAPEPELARITQGLLVTYVKVPGATPDTYAMDHSAALVLVNPRAQLAGFFTPPFQPAVMAEDLARLIGSAP